ncbi:MAG TPA: precorrin-2 C(20)-methyltransferase [Nitrospirae bacterium]|nr:cobalt-precorrin-2 C(20)-methyltransferase [bacterium BMS3Abin09]GBE40634.1 cobalt-precorrin-2 C(20)-methyltransferase [bacterium BMS3Bbin09]HDN95066.1 precorrin-2 C(20)-methyltransferase [Nitrospirota bacterium]HDO67179.1 precorrin-2 C(20)-methyltransferase [Nitrospirota bacterium]HDZ84810.1 precorrin-2 C(20)-methyltransferase [Nitrospirota bacterium]
MSGKLSVIGIGPGDPELLTLKAVRVIKESPVICVPKGRAEGASLALSIVEKAVDLGGKEIIEAHFPMVKTREQGSCEENVGAIHELPLLDEKWDETVSLISNKLKNGADVAFLTLGDPAIYSTFFYLYDKLLAVMPELKIEIVPGISSINASASRLNMSLGLGNDKIAVLPANYMGDLKTILGTFDTVVLMKVNKVFNEILEILSGMGLVENAKCISKVGMKDEKIFEDIREIKEEELNYFSIVILKK